MFTSKIEIKKIVNGERGSERHRKKNRAKERYIAMNDSKKQTQRK
jgi:hypothetical protein